MAVSLHKVPVSLPDSKEPTKLMIRDIIAMFLTKEWPSVDTETLTTSYHASFANSHCRVERPQPTTGHATEPLKVFIKFHNLKQSDITEAFKSLLPNKHEEAIFCHEYARSGLGAKVYGLFQTQDGTLGRIDEFLEARTLEPEDVENADIRADIARGLAVFHAMEVSIPKKPVEEFYEAIISGLKKYYKSDKLKTLGREGGVSIDDLVDFDFTSRLEKVMDKMRFIGSKTAWCIHDVQFMNIMVKNDPKEGESKIALIDFEFVMRNYRGFDIGGHFMQKMFKWFDEKNKLTDCRDYTEEEKKHFCEEYAKAWNEVTGDTDTNEQVFLESEYGYMLAICFDIHNMLCFMNAEDSNDALDLVGLNELFARFKKQYIKLGLEAS